MEVRTDFFMGYSVTSVGETYLVYAHRGQGRRFEMERCGRTARFSSSGDDLAYLHFIRHGGCRPANRNGTGVLRIRCFSAWNRPPATHRGNLK